MSRIKTLAGSRVGVASVAAVLAAVVVGGVGWASIPDSGGFIHGCYKTGGTNHKLSIIDDSVTASCPHGYTSLNWSTGQLQFTATGTTSTNYSFVDPSGVTSATVEAWGGGGGGGGGGAGNGLFDGGQGGEGGQGAYIRALVSLTPGTTYYITAGGGGTGGMHGSNNYQYGVIAADPGGTGATSNFSNLVQANGGNGGDGGAPSLANQTSDGVPGNPGLGGGSTWGQGTIPITAQTGSTGSSSQGQGLVGAGGSGGPGGFPDGPSDPGQDGNPGQPGLVIVNFGPTT